MPITLMTLPGEIQSRIFQNNDLSEKDKVSWGSASKYWNNFVWGELKNELQKKFEFDASFLWSKQNIMLLIDAQDEEKGTRRTLEQSKKILELLKKPQENRSLDDLINIGVLTRERANNMAQSEFDWFNNNVNLLTYLCWQTVFFHVINHGAAHGTELISALYNKGIDINVPITDEAETALHIASQLGYTEIVKCLFELGAKLDVVTQQGDTVLHLAAQAGHVEIANFLLSTGQADLKKENVEHEFPLTCAQKGFLNAGKDQYPGERPSYFEIVKLLVEQDVNVEELLLLHVASTAEGDYAKPAIEFLIARGVDINARESSGKTALDWARSKKHARTIRFLTEQGAYCGYEIDTANFIQKYGPLLIATVQIRFPWSPGWICQICDFLMPVVNGFTTHTRIGRLTKAISAAEENFSSTA